MTQHTQDLPPVRALRVAVIVGSLRRDSTTRRIARAAMARAPRGMQCDVVDIGDLPHFNQDLEHEPPAAWMTFRQAIAAVDGVLFFTPEYNRSFPGCLKNAIDIGGRPHGSALWNGMPAGIVSVSPHALGGFGANHALRQTLVYLNMPAMQQPEAYIAMAETLMDAAGTVTRATTDKFLRQYMQAFADWVHLLRSPVLVAAAT
ncbi:MAG: NAD(P)H-dependent oxidoreductase [Gemmatimonadetes bacterium]|nr:NAD(P)H-dependent oxidoreductase [Gemmatimonadota bacterium]